MKKGLFDGFKQHIKNMFNKFSSYWFTYMNPITLSTRNIYYFKKDLQKCIYIYIYIYTIIYIISSDKQNIPQGNDTQEVFKMNIM